MNNISVDVRAGSSAWFIDELYWSQTLGRTHGTLLVVAEPMKLMGITQTFSKFERLESANPLVNTISVDVRTVLSKRFIHELYWSQTLGRTKGTM